VQVCTLITITIQSRCDYLVQDLLSYNKVRFLHPVEKSQCKILEEQNASSFVADILLLFPTALLIAVCLVNDIVAL
jgi:hypothetical protein